MKEAIDARKEKIDRKKAWELITANNQVYIGRGKKVLSFEPGQGEKEEILKAAMGRSGNLRAPAVRAGERLFIGYNEAVYGKL